MRRRHLVLLALAAIAGCKNPQPCPKPLVECGGQCVDVQSDPRFCRDCGTACRANEVCLGGACGVDTQPACPDRVGGGFVTIGYPNGGGSPCAGQVVKLWVRSATFLDDAVAVVGSTTPARAPVVDVLAGADCDAAWRWHADVLTPALAAPAAGVACDVCPSVIQANVPAYVVDVRRWCPSDARVLAVERRAP